MLADQITVALSMARGRTMFDEISRTIWGGMAQGMLSENEAQRFSEQLELLRSGEGIEAGSAGNKSASPRRGEEISRPRFSIFPPRRKQTAPDPRSSLARRRRLASTGPVPPSLAAHFTTGELSVLRIIGDEWRGKGACVRTLAEIAARAGVSRTTTQNAIRQARAMGMLKVEERRVRGAKNLPNRITVVCAEWTTWLKRGPKGTSKDVSKPDRVQKTHPHGYPSLSKGPSFREPEEKRPPLPVKRGLYRSREREHFTDPTL